VLYSKPMRQEDVNSPGAYLLDNGNGANSVQIQPGGRVALLNLKEGIGTFRTRTLTIKGISDARANPLETVTTNVLTKADQGIVLRGKVYGLNGSPAANIPVTLTFYDQRSTSQGCISVVIRASQKFTDADGNFTFDFILAEVGYSVSATDTSGLSPDASKEIIARVLEANRNNEVIRQKLIEIAAQPNLQDALLHAFNAGDLGTAVAAAEGLDRAEFRDSVAQNGARIGTEVPVTLRFRGRGTLTGRVLAADGVTPLGGAAANLFPDPDSRELGRGVLSDNEGRFAFYGVPLGVYSLQATTSDKRFRAFSGLLDHVGQSNHIDLVLPNLVQPVAALHGQVFERDGVTPHAAAQVYVLKNPATGVDLPKVAAILTSDANGFYMAPNVPADNWDVVAVSSDRRRKGSRLNVILIPEVVNYVNIQLQGLTTVQGRVIFDDGRAAPNALVAGGEALVRTDVNGRFSLTNVPTGRRTIRAGMERNEAAQINVTRFGGTEIEVLPGIENIVEIRLEPRGRIIGRVFDASGRPVPNVRVAIPRSAGFQWVKADSSGRYSFDNMALGDYILSAPSPPIKEDVEAVATRTIETIKNASSNDELAGAVAEAFTAFTGVTEARLNPEPFIPPTWGYTRTGILRDNETVVADIRMLPPGTIAGRTINSQGAAVGAQVVLHGLGPNAVGGPGVIFRGGTISDAASGEFSFDKRALAGPFNLVASSPLIAGSPMVEGVTSIVDPDSTNNVLQFPSQAENSGRLTGYVLNPDGSSAGAEVSVNINYLSGDYTILTDTNGFFDTQLKLPKGNYLVTVTNLAGIVGQTLVTVKPAVTNRTTVTLLGTGDLTINVRLADGTPATNAAVNVKAVGFPQETAQGVTDSNGQLHLGNLYEGPYAIDARQIAGITLVAGRTGAVVVVDTTVSADVVLGASGSIQGVFLQNDGVTPVGFAQITATQRGSTLGFAATFGAGEFEFAGVPLGRTILHGKNPVTGRAGIAEVNLGFNNETQRVTLVERDLGEVTGFVLAGDGSNVIAGAEVQLTVPSGSTPKRSVTTGLDGSFSFPGTPAGPVDLSALDPLSNSRASAAGTLAENTASIRVDLRLPPTASLLVTVLEPDRVSPATNTTVVLSQGNAELRLDTDPAGQVTFPDLPLGSYTLEAGSLVTSQSRSSLETNLNLDVPGATVHTKLILPGVVTVEGQVLQSDGRTPVVGALLELRSRESFFLAVHDRTFSDSNGLFRISNVPLGVYDLTASQLALAAHFAATNRVPDQTNRVSLVLNPSGTVQGVLVRSNGVTTIRQVEVFATFASQTVFSGRSSGPTDATGAFVISNVPLGDFTVGAVVPAFNGILLVNGRLTNNGQVLNLGAVPLDEENPRVIQVVPANTSQNIPTNTTIDLLFSEPLDPKNINERGIYLRSATDEIPAAVQLLPEPVSGALRLVRLIPRIPLRSLTTYEVIALSGERRNALGTLVGSGPTDVVGRPLLVPFVSSFTTGDNDKPFVDSLSPADGAGQVDPRAVIRVVYNEPIRFTNFTIRLTGPNGAVAGSANLGPELKILVFTPNEALSPNSIYNLEIDGVSDLAGNVAAVNPLRSSFTTLDTLGPAITTLRLAGNQPPVAGATVILESILAVNEQGVRVRYTSDLDPIGTGNVPPYSVSTVLPASGRVTLRAIATDRFGNDGPLAELSITVVSNQPPTVFLTRENPPFGPLLSGGIFSIQVRAEDDVGVTDIQLSSSGALSTNITLTGGTTNVLQFTVPAEATAGTPLHFQAQASDTQGAASGVASLDFEIADGTAPVIAILSPTNNSALNINVPLSLTVRSLDNSTNLQLRLEVFGAISATQTLAVVSAPNEARTNTFTVSLAGAVANGASLNVAVHATDPAGNVATATASYVLPDVNPPQLVTVTPAGLAVRQSLWLAGASFEFSEALAAASISNRFIVTNDAGSATPFTIALQNGDTVARVRYSSLPLVPGATYTNIVLPGISDQQGNPWVDANGSPIPPEGQAFTFTTARILSVAPTNNTSVVAGQDVTVNIRFEAGLGANFLRASIGTNPSVQISLPGGGTNAVLVLPAPAAPGAALLNLALSDNSSFSAPYLLPPVLLNIRAASLDDDGDGLPNDYEADHGFDPFTPDACKVSVLLITSVILELLKDIVPATSIDPGKVPLVFMANAPAGPTVNLKLPWTVGKLSNDTRKAPKLMSVCRIKGPPPEY